MKCRVRDVDVYYEVRGNGRPVLMLHGYWLDHQCMVGAMEPIFDGRIGWQRIYLDMPGMGQTPAADWIIGSDQMLDVVDGFVEQVIGQRPFAIAALSYGGYIARGLLRRRFAQINGMFLFASVIDRAKEDPYLPEHQIIAQDSAAMALVPPAMKPVIESTMTAQDTRFMQRLPAEFAVGFERAQPPFLEGIQQNGYNFSFDPDDLPGIFDKPTLIIAGRQDSGVGYWRAAQLIPTYPRATFAVLDRSGHGLNLEQEAIFNQLAHDWLNRLEEAQSGLPYDTGAERTLRIEVAVPAPVAEVWAAWTTEAGVKSFFAPACHIDLRVGGAYEMYFDLDAPEGKRGGEGLKILAIQPEKMLSFTWNSPPHLAEVRDQHTAVALRFYPLANGHTRVILNHSGWGEGEQWDEAYRYFASAWGDVVLPRLKQRFESD